MGPEARDDLLERGYSRRQLAGIATVFGIGAVAATAGRPAWGAPVGGPGAIEMPTPLADNLVRLGMNECWTGPLAPGQAAAAKIIAECNRYYPHRERDDFRSTVSKLEGVPVDYVSPWPGSSDPLCRAVVTFCSPSKALVIADPVFELPGSTAAWLNAPVRKVPLTPDFAHDVKAMVAADPSPGLYYICTPNNPTGTVTPLADIAWLADNKPAGSMVLVDEAYIHFAGVPSAASLVAAGKDVMVLRTFSKIFGMAGMRMGYLMARPDVIERMQRYDGGTQSGFLPNPSLACATASLTAADLIAARRHEMEAARDYAIEHVKKRGLTVLPTRANMFMIDWKTRPAKDVRTAFAAKNVAIGRSWAVWPNMSRVTVGSMDEMRAFTTALDQVWT
jgi:histidinol-phosphate aminotransferase